MVGYESYLKYWLGFDGNYVPPFRVEVAGISAGNRVCLGTAHRVWWNKVVVLGRTTTEGQK